VRTVNGIEIIFAFGPSRVRARFHRDGSLGECEIA
jgi:hypothetical protein